MNLLFMGPPGAGKGTQATIVSERAGLVHLSTGDLFRAHVAEQTELGRTAQRYMDAGQYVPDEVTNQMVRERLGAEDARAGFLLDGYPRTIEQVAELDAILADLGSALEGVISLSVDGEELVQRLLERAKTSGRSDDTEEVIRKRQELYQAETAPLLQVYRERGLLHEVDGVGSVAEVAERITAALPR